MRATIFSSNPRHVSMDFRIVRGDLATPPILPNSSITVKMSNNYYCSLCGEKNVSQLCAICFCCRQILKRNRSQSERPPEGNCFYCQEYFIELTTDHVVPIIRGGPELPWNLVAACLHCNLQKNDRIPSEWCPQNEEAIKIQKSVSNILPRMRNGKLLDNESVIYFRTWALTTSFAASLSEAMNSLKKSDSVGKRIYTLWTRTHDLRVHLIDHPKVLGARLPPEEE